MSGRGRVSVGVGAVALRDNQVLLIRMNRGGNRGQWAVPGGYLEPGESLEMTVIREVREETGLEFRPSGILAVRCGVRDRPDREETNLYLAFVGSCGDGEPRPDGQEVTEAAFRPLALAIDSEDVAGLTRQVLEATASGENLLKLSSEAVGTRNRYRSYHLYR